MDPPNDFNVRSRTALAARRLSLCEHFLLCAAGYRVNLPPAALARHAQELAEGDPRGAFTAAEYEAALGDCLARGLLRVLDDRDFDERGRRTHGLDSALGSEESFDDYAPGQVDFTPEGHALHLATLREIFGPPER
ncbi:MAG: hypothetical protein JWM10_5073 [Myxococcaceae bacterium]|nr:hypothetical protein [Myxococcaceae bacterium]